MFPFLLRGVGLQESTSVVLAESRNGLVVSVTVLVRRSSYRQHAGQPTTVSRQPDLRVTVSRQPDLRVSKQTA